MATTLGFKDVIDVPVWRPESPALAVSVNGSILCSDPRGTAYRHPYLYYLRAGASLDAFNPLTGDWLPLATPGGLGPGLSAGSWMVFHPSAGPRGVIAAGATTTSVVLSTALPAAVGANQLANRGDGVGFRIRIVGLTAGKTEEKYITSCTSGTTPTITLDSALTFTPATSDIYEIISGRLFMCGSGALAAGSFKYYDIATNSYSGNLSITNLPATLTTDSAPVALSEAMVAYNQIPGDGFVAGAGTYNNAVNQCIVASASSSTTLTAVGMPADLQTNEYTNFQVRIVEDTGTPTAVGQRRRIASHTSGATGVFTVAAFGVTPSATCKFVVENDDDKILMRSTNTTSVYNYNIAANTWDTTTWAAALGNGAGCTGAQLSGISRDVTHNARHSYVFFLRGGASSLIDYLDIAGGATGVWSNGIVYGNVSQTFTTGSNCATDYCTNGGKYMYLAPNGTQRLVRFDMRNRVMEPSTYLRFPQGAALVGPKMACMPFVDGATKLNFLYQITQSQAQMFSLATPR